MTFWIVLGVIALIVIWLIALYNGLVGGRNQAQRNGAAGPQVRIK